MTHTYHHRDGRVLTTAMSQFEVGDRYKMPIGDEAEQWVAEVRCPNKKCSGWFVLAVKRLKSTHFFTRSCPYCFRTAVLPDELLKYVARNPNL